MYYHLFSSANEGTGNQRRKPSCDCFSIDGICCIIECWIESAPPRTRAGFWSDAGGLLGVIVNTSLPFPYSFDIILQLIVCY